MSSRNCRKPHTKEEEYTLHGLLRRADAALHDANQAFATGVECCAPHDELLAMAHEVAELQQAYRRAKAAVPWTVKVKHLQESTTAWLASGWSTTF